MARSSLIFRFIYTSVYFLFYILLLGLLIITPADAIQRSIQNGQKYNVWMLIIIYAVTIASVGFIYFVRLYVNKTVLADIPKAWVPIEAGDLPKAVYKMIVSGLDRSAVIAYEARPRVDPPEQQRVAQAAADDLGISTELQKSLWSNIEHNGWASPKSPDLPNLQYTTVLSELPNLIEAKAMTLAPSDQGSQLRAESAPALDPEAVALLQRPPQLSLRGYLEHLGGLGVLRQDETATSFLQLYEYARFSTRPISNDKFRELMHLFAEILRTMEPLDLAMLYDDDLDDLSRDDMGQGRGDDDEQSYDGGDADGTNPSTTPSQLSRSATMSTQASVRRPAPRSSSWANYRTAPTTPLSWQFSNNNNSNTINSNFNNTSNNYNNISRKSSSSSNSFARTRHPYGPSGSGAAAASSSPSVRSGASSSIIRLATREDDENVPYVLNLRGTAESLPQ